MSNPMNRMAVAIPAGALAGAVIGLMIGGLWLQWQLGVDVNAANPLVLLTGFPGIRAALTDPWRTAYLIVLAAAAAFALVALVFTFTHRLTTYGQSHFQTKREIRKNGLIQPMGSGLVFAKFGEPAKDKATFITGSYNKFPHILMIAPTRSGKGVSFVIPNVLLFPGTNVIMDVKGEIFEATSRYRQAQDDKVFRFAPFDFEHHSNRYNPLERISKITDTDQRFTELSMIASYFLIPKNDKGGASDFIIGGRQLFVAAGMLALERGTPTIGAITRILFGHADRQDAYTGFANETKHEQTATIFREFTTYSDRTMSSYASVINGAGLGLWLNPRIEKVTNTNDFSWDDIRREPHSIYIVATSDQMETLAPLLRLMFGEMIATMRSRIPDLSVERWPVQLILDEYDQLGYMPIVVQSLKQLAGHNVRVAIITQSLPGLDSIYNENERLSIEAACGMKLYLTPNESKTAKELSEYLGKTTKLSVSDSYSQSADGLLKRSISRRNEERPLLSPDEVLKIDPNKVILLPERQHPIMADKIIYHEDPYFKAIMASQKGPLPYPDAIRAELDAMKVRLTLVEEGRVAYPPAAAQSNAASETVPAQDDVQLARQVAEEEAEAARVEEAEHAASRAEAAQYKEVTVNKPTLARDVAQEAHGPNDTRTDDEVMDVIAAKTKSVSSIMQQISGKMIDKGLSALVPPEALAEETVEPPAQDQEPVAKRA